MPTAAEWFIGGLRERGIEWIATLTGNGLGPLLEAAARAGMRLVDTRNEQTASYLAEACGRLTGTAGVCLVSSGIGHMNALSGVAAAWFAGTPMLLVSGAGELATRGMGHYQDMDQAAAAAPVTKFSRTIDRPERVIDLLEQALTAAQSRPYGPVHLTFPVDVQQAEVSGEQLTRPARPLPSSLPEEDVEEIARTLARSERPLIIAGSGLFYERNAAAFSDFLARVQIPAVVPIWDRGPIDAAVPAFMGVLGASSGGPRLLADTDCVVMAGASLDYRVGYLRPPAVRPDAEVVYMEHSWERLAQLLPPPSDPNRAWFEEARRRRDECRCAVERRGAEQARHGTHAIQILAALREVLTPDTCLLIDGGNIGQWAHQLLCDRYPGNWLTNGPGGAVGWGLGGGMAARLVFPERPVILLSGDGAFTFNVSDLESAVRQKLHFVAIVADDQGWGLMQAGLGPVRFAALAESLGAQAITIRERGEIAPAIRRALANRTVTVIHVPIAGGAP